MKPAQNPTPINWKQRYQELLEQQEKQQTIYQRKHGLMNDAIRSLIQYGRDIDPAADEKLLAMGGLLRKKSFKNSELARVIEAMEDQLAHSLTERSEHQKNINRNLKTLAKLAQTFTTQRDVKRELAEFRKAIDVRPLRYPVISSHIERLTELQAIARSEVKSGQSLLQRWFGQPGVDTPGQILQALDTIAGSLTRLLGEIEPGSDMMGSFEIATDLLESGLTTENVDVVIKSVTDVVVAAIHSDRTDMTNYLSDMNAKLQEATLGITDSQSLLSEEISVSEAYRQSVETSVGRIRQAVEVDDDLELLKHRINESLDLMASAAVQHRNRGADIQSRLSVQLEALATRARLLEQQGKEAEQKIAEQRRRALTDNLTGLPNREAYEEAASKEVQRWQRYGRPLCIAVVDIDLFKGVNDSYGHSAGDAVLREVAGISNDRLRGSDFLARYGGEEFVLLLPETELDQAVHVMNSLREAVEQANIQWEGKHLGLTVSIGVADFKGKDILQSAFTRADRALYQAKAKGRNLVEVAAE